MNKILSLLLLAVAGVANAGVTPIDLGTGSSSSSVAQSSTTATPIPKATGTNGALGACIAGSTLTVTTTATFPRISYTWNGQIQNGSSGAYTYCGILLDSAFPVGTNSYSVQGYGAANGGIWPANFTYVSEILSVGEHKVCLACASSGGSTWTAGGSNSDPDAGNRATMRTVP